MGLITGGGRRGRGGFGMAHFLLLIIGVSWLSFSSVEGLKCYWCENNDCKIEKDCSAKGQGDAEGCIKIAGKLNGEEAVGKGCAKGLKEGCQEGELMGIKGTVCYCKGDLCNASTKKYSPSLMILLAASTLTALVTKFGVLRGGI